MDSQAFDRTVDTERRRFLLTSAVAAAGAVVVWSSFGCDTPQGMRQPKNVSVPGGGAAPGQNPAGMNGAPAAEPPAKGNAEQPQPQPDTQPKPQTIDRPPPPDKEPAIRIKTKEVPPSKPFVSVEGAGPKVWIVEKGSGRAGVLAMGPVEIRWTDSGWRVTELAGKRAARVIDINSRGTLDVSSLANEPAKVRIDGQEWPGSLRLVPTDSSGMGGGFDLVHEVPMETYLAGVISKELINGWGVSTHRAQAIAARSYAVCEMAVWRPQRHYDVFADERSQAWVGKATHQKSIDAVRDTAGQMLVFEDRVVPAYFSSCCGGARASAQDTISSEIRHDIAPLRAGAGKPNCGCMTLSKNAKWEMKLKVDAVSSVLPQWARLEGYPSLQRIGLVRELTVIARNAQGRPVRVRIVDDKGWKCELPAERMRWALNASPVNPALKKPLAEQVKSAYFEPTIKGGEIALKGFGFGHGVGMCQYGAESMSKAGKAAPAILANYYPGATLVRAY